MLVSYRVQLFGNTYKIKIWSEDWYYLLPEQLLLRFPKIVREWIFKIRICEKNKLLKKHDIINPYSHVIIFGNVPTFARSGYATYDFLKGYVAGCPGNWLQTSATNVGQPAAVPKMNFKQPHNVICSHHVYVSFPIYMCVYIYIWVNRIFRSI